MRDIRQGACPQCDYHEIVQAHPRVFGYYEGEGPWAPPPPHQLNVFICRRCGFAQWYAAAPEAIPIAEDTGTRLIKGQPPSGPYR